MMLPVSSPTLLPTKKVANGCGETFLVRIVAFRLEVAVHKAAEKTFYLRFSRSLRRQINRLNRDIFGGCGRIVGSCGGSRASVGQVFQGLSGFFNFARRSYALRYSIPRDNKCTLRNRKGNVMAAQETSRSQHSTHFKSERSVLNVQRFDLVVVAQIKARVVVELERRVNGKECIERLRSGRYSNGESITSSFDTSKNKQIT